MKKRKIRIGFASSMFQTSGLIYGPSNWTKAAEKGTVPDPTQPLPHWDRLIEDLDLMKKVHINTYRISLEWSDIEPLKGQFDTHVIKRYRMLFEECLKRDIAPMVSLYHFNEPLWFTEIGSFEQEENIEHFIRYCVHVYAFFSPQVSWWCTINEPAIQAFMSYWTGKFPPHVKYNFEKTVNFLKNMLKAHVDVYTALKKLPCDTKTHIGIVHSVFKFKPLYRFDPIAYGVCQTLNTLTHELVMQFFKTGKLHYPIIFSRGIHYENIHAKSANDFIGLNFYANLFLGPNLDNGYGPTCHDKSTMGDMSLSLDPNGFSDAIDEIATLGLPIAITEIGIADKKDRLRSKFLKLYFEVIEQKLLLHINIRSIHLWTAFDNYEWHEGNGPSFGFFDAYRQPRESVNTLKNIIKTYQKHGHFFLKDEPSNHITETTSHESNLTC